MHPQFEPKPMRGREHPFSAWIRDEGAAEHPHHFPAAEMMELAHELSIILRIAFADAVDRVRLEHGVSEDLWHRAETEEMNTPLVEIHSGLTDIKHCLEQHGYPEDGAVINEDEIVLLINLPDPMRIPYPELRADPLWSKSYDQAINAIWDKMSSFAEQHHVAITRINPIGIHDVQMGGYYY